MARRRKSIQDIRSQRDRLAMLIRDRQSQYTNPYGTFSISTRREYDKWQKRLNRVEEAANRYEKNINRTKAYVQDRENLRNARINSIARGRYEDNPTDEAVQADMRLRYRQYPTSTYRDAAYSNRPKQQSTPALNTPLIANEARGSRGNSSNASMAAKGNTPK